jgi:hypothetical protein
LFTILTEKSIFKNRCMDEGCEIFKNENKFSMEESNVDENLKTW